MKTILINGISAKSGGGKSILKNLLSAINVKNTELNFVVIVPAKHGYENYSMKNVVIIPFSTKKLPSIFQFLFYFFSVHKIIRKHNICLILNLADIIIPTRTKQLFLFDWSYAAYPDSIVWSLMKTKERYHKKLKLFLFKKMVDYPTVVYAQTESIKKRLSKYYRLKKSGIIPNAVSLDNLTGGNYKDFKLPKDRFLFLCLSKYYIHKNIESFIPLSKMIRDSNLPYCIIITINKEQHSNAKRIIELIQRENLEKILINIGEVKMEHVPSLYEQTDALLLPTLLESFSGTFVEAMFHKKPIFTSKYDFSQDICRNCAIYFDPLKTEEIFQAICLIKNKRLMEEKVANGTLRLKDFPNWYQATEIILNEINKNL